MIGITMKTGDGTQKSRGVLIAKLGKFNLTCFFLVQILFLLGCSDSQEIKSINGATMGTWYNIKYIPSNKEGLDNSDLVKAGVDSTLEHVNQQMSTYDPNSEISIFNSSGDTTWHPVSTDFANVVSIAQLISDQSDGAFDITVGPLVNLWGFGPGNRERVIPDEDDIQLARKLVGHKNLLVRINPPALKKKIPGLYVDLSSIAKGYGVDRVGDFLESRGLHRYMVEIGGEIKTSGSNDGNPWKIGIQTPDETQGLEAILKLNGESVATSGDYHNYFEQDGRRYSHTIDPKSGRPITHKLASISVIYPNCTGADAYATAIDVLGPTLGLEFARKMKLSAFFIVKGEGKFEERMTRSFNQYLSKKIKE